MSDMIRDAVPGYDVSRISFLESFWNIGKNRYPPKSPEGGLGNYRAFHDMKSSSCATKYLSNIQRYGFFI
jgi:hypothetical protein